jgi:hypothetical protein
VDATHPVPSFLGNQDWAPMLVKMPHTAAAPSTTTIASTTTNWGISDAFLSNNIQTSLKRIEVD